MSYRNGTYVAFHAGGTANPTASDLKYYNMLRAWSANKNIEFRLIDSHEKTADLRDTSLKSTFRDRMAERLRLSKHLFLIITYATQFDTDWVPFEIGYAIDTCGLPVIAAYPDIPFILDPASLAPYWPTALTSRINGGNARVIHIPFKVEPVIDSISQFGVNNTKYPVNGLGFYSLETQVRWGLIPA